MTTLHDRLLACGQDLRTRYLCDESHQVSLADAADATSGPHQFGHFSGASVVLAMDSQLSTVLALLALDGVARRMILAHPDNNNVQMDVACRATDAQVVLDHWPPRVQTAGDNHWKSADIAGSTEWVLFTSGTTSQPKLVSHTLTTLAGHLSPAHPDATERIWSTFYDIRRYGGLQILLRALVSGETIVLSGRSETMGAFLHRAGAGNVTHLLGTPSHWRKALISGEIAAIDPAYIRLSGEVADQAILDQLHRAFPRAQMVHAFATTEAGLVIEVADGKAGLPADLVRATGKFAEIDLSGGTLRVRSARNAKGYLDKTSKAVTDRDGFVDTDDMVTLENDRWHFRGRRTGVINVGGQKVHPEEVEAVILQHPSVRMCAVHGRSNPITGALVEADVVCQPEPERSAIATGPFYRELVSDISAFCRARLPAFKVPARINLKESLDVAPSGKVMRRHA